MKTYRLFLLALVGVLLLGVSVAGALEKPQADEFAYLSNQTRQAMELPVSELEGLVKRCDGLLEKTDKLKMPEKKIMRKKIRNCAGFFFMSSVQSHGPSGKLQRNSD